MSANADAAAITAAERAIATILRDLETSINGVVDGVVMEEFEVWGGWEAVRVSVSGVDGHIRPVEDQSVMTMDDAVKRTCRRIVITTRKVGSRQWVTGGA